MIFYDFMDVPQTSPAVAEKLGRLWIGCGLGRRAIHVARKRFHGIEGYKPFEVLNPGKYERQYRLGMTFGEAKNKNLTDQALYECLPEEVRYKVRKWADYIDYWAVDWDFQNDRNFAGTVCKIDRGIRPRLFAAESGLDGPLCRDVPQRQDCLRVAETIELKPFHSDHLPLNWNVSSTRRSSWPVSAWHRTNVTRISLRKERSDHGAFGHCHRPEKH